jgi:UrcA family protein
MRPGIRIFLLSMLAVSASSLAMADTSVQVKSEVVRYDDLRLISNVGAAVLYGRLKGAAERVCGGPVDNVQHGQQQRYRTCVNDTLKKAVADVNHPILTSFYDSKRNPGVPNPNAVAKAP